MNLKAPLLLCLALLSAQVTAAPWPTALPDPCTNVRHRGDMIQHDFPASSLTQYWSLAYPAPYLGLEDQLRAAVFIVNANGASEGHYRPLGEHLARQDLLVRIIQRPAADWAVAHVESEIQATLQTYGLPDDFPIVLLGHSMGGGSVLELTRLFANSYNIDAVINLAPNAINTQGFLGVDAPAYLALYGSQDEDMQGTTDQPREAFMAYDSVNTEGTTASAFNRWMLITANMVDKAMVYVRGADHSGFIRHEGLIAAIAHQDYLSRDDQFCIGKAYVTAFLDWKLDGQSGYRPMFHGEITPPSVASIVTDEADYFGNPAGEPVQIFHQFSPRKRYVIADFWSTPPMSLGLSMQASTLYPYLDDSHARHYTRALRLAWQSYPAMRALTLSVPSNRRRLSNFDTFQLRIGQIDTDQRAYANPPETEPLIFLTLVDGDNRSVHRLLNSYGSIPGPDARTNASRGHSHMNTLRIPMDDLDSIDLTDVRQIRFWVYPNTRGEVMIDSIEAVYDD